MKPRGALGALPPAVFLLGTAHMLVDGYGNIYAPLLPMLIPRLDLSLAAAGTLAMFFQIAASVSQLGFGHLADRWRPRVLLIAGPFLGVVGLSMIGLAWSKFSLGAILVAGGLGCAAFHPPAAALAHRLGGRHAGLAMSIHITGGTLGFSLGPLLFAPLVDRFGLQMTPFLALPGVALLIFFIRNLPPVERLSPHALGGLSALRPYAKPLTFLYLIVVLRTLTSLAFATFVPVMLTRRGMSISEAGAIIALYLFASGLGGFLGGPAADRWGARLVIALSLVLSVPFLLIAPLVGGMTFATMLAIGGFFLQSTLPVNVTFAQTIAPVGAATVSSLMMGFAWGTGGLSVPFVGMLADRIGIEETLLWLSIIPLIAAAFAWPLPPRRTESAARPSDVGISESS